MSLAPLPPSSSKWASLAERVAKLQDGESIALQAEGDLTEVAGKIRRALNGVRACRSVRRSVRVVDGKIVIRREGLWPALSAFQRQR